MPLYESKCVNNHIHVETRNMSDTPATTICNTCNQQLKPVFGTPLIKFTGNGFNAKRG